MEKIKMMDVSKTLGDKKVLDTVNLELESGRLYGIVGENGSGKTMLLRLLAGLIRPDGGTLLYGENSVRKYTQVLNVGLSIENIGLYDDMTVYENMKYYGKLSGDCTKAQIISTLKRVGLVEYKNKAFSKLSLGLKQRTVLAQAILSEPELLLLDEPTNGLDADAREDFKKVITEEKERGCCVVVVSHDISFFEGCLDKLYKMENGKLSEK